MFVLGGVSGWAFFSLENRVVSSTTSFVFADLENIKTLLTMYKIEKGHYPLFDQGLNSIVGFKYKNAEVGFREYPLDYWGGKYRYSSIKVDGTEKIIVWTEKEDGLVFGIFVD